MVSKELKNLSRRELVDIIYQMKKNEQLLHEEVTSLQEALQDKRIRLSSAGSIAEAAVSVTNVFSAAQASADLYLQEIACMKEDAQAECQKMIDEAKQKAAQILSEAERQNAILKIIYEREREKWYKLHQQVQTLENKLSHFSYED